MIHRTSWKSKSISHYHYCPGQSFNLVAWANKKVLKLKTNYPVPSSLDAMWLGRGGWSFLGGGGGRDLTHAAMVYVVSWDRDSLWTDWQTRQKTLPCCTLWGWLFISGLVLPGWRFIPIPWCNGMYCIMDQGHPTPSRQQTDTTENITFLHPSDVGGNDWGNLGRSHTLS